MSTKHEYEFQAFYVEASKIIDFLQKHGSHNVLFVATTLQYQCFDCEEFSSVCNQVG